jgi:hypothetical protein
MVQCLSPGCCTGEVVLIGSSFSLETCAIGTGTAGALRGFVVAMLTSNSMYAGSNDNCTRRALKCVLTEPTVLSCLGTVVECLEK